MADSKKQITEDVTNNESDQCSVCGKMYPLSKLQEWFVGQDGFVRQICSNCSQAIDTIENGKSSKAAKDSAVCIMKYADEIDDDETSLKLNAMIRNTGLESATKQVLEKERQEAVNSDPRQYQSDIQERSLPKVVKTITWIFYIIFTIVLIYDHERLQDLVSFFENSDAYEQTASGVLPFMVLDGIALIISMFITVLMDLAVDVSAIRYKVGRIPLRNVRRK